MNKHNEVIRTVAEGISRLWRWWYGCSTYDRQSFKMRIIELVEFCRTDLPLFGYYSWPAYLRITVFFSHNGSHFSFAVMYFINRLYRKLVLLYQAQSFEEENDDYSKEGSCFRWK